MYREIFGYIKRGGKVDEAMLKALYALMEPTLKSLRMKRVPASDIDDRLVEAFPAFYEYYALWSSSPPHFWEAPAGGLPEFKALREMKKNLRAVWKELYPPKPRKKKK